MEADIIKEEQVVIENLDKTLCQKESIRIDGGCPSKLEKKNWNKTIMLLNGKIRTEIQCHRNQLIFLFQYTV